jgi:hypothetical protein
MELYNALADSLPLIIHTVLLKGTVSRNGFGF